jgi:cobalt-zinc-cadmium efflux system outer membrane protein
MKSMVIAAVLVFFSLSLYRPAGAEDAGPAEDLSRLIDSAIANNPELKASDARWQMFKNRVSHAGRLEDPMLTLKIQNGIVNDPFNFRKDSMTQKVVGISQQVPFWGKRKLREEVAEREAESYWWLVEERKLELAKMVKETWYQLYAVDKSLQIVGKNISIMDDFITLAETKYSVGQGAQQDLFKAQVERSRLLDMQIVLTQQRKSLQANLDALLSRPSETPIGAIPDFGIKPLMRSYDELRNIACENRPMIKSLNALIDKGTAGRKLAEKEYWPDFNVSFEYMQRDRFEGSAGDDMYALGVTFNLPVQRHHRHEMVAESDAEARMAAEELKALKNSIGSGVTDLLAQIERRRKQFELYRDGIIPQAEQSLESATIGYRVGKIDFLTLLDSRVTLFNYEREYYDALADYQMKLAQLEALVGKVLQ